MIPDVRSLSWLFKERIGSLRYIFVKGYCALCITLLQHLHSPRWKSRELMGAGRDLLPFLPFPFRKRLPWNRHWWALVLILTRRLIMKAPCFKRGDRNPAKSSALQLLHLPWCSASVCPRAFDTQIFLRVYTQCEKVNLLTHPSFLLIIKRGPVWLDINED